MWTEVKPKELAKRTTQWSGAGTFTLEMTCTGIPVLAHYQADVPAEVHVRSSDEGN